MMPIVYVTKYQLAPVIFVDKLLENIKLNIFVAGCIFIKPTQETLEGLKVELFKWVIAMICILKYVFEYAEPEYHV